MSVEDYIFDEDGDLILCLSRPADREINPVENFDDLVFSEDDEVSEEFSDSLDDLDYAAPTPTDLRHVLPPDLLEGKELAPGKGPLGKEPSGRVPLGRVPLGRVPLGRGPLGKGPLSKESTSRESTSKESVGKESAGKEPAGKEPAGKEPAGKESASKESAGKEQSDKKPSDSAIAIEKVVEKPADIGLRMIVSSKHMMLVSPVFKAMLQPHALKQGRTLNTISKVTIPLPDDDWLAMIVILYVIHGKTTKTPRQVSLKVLRNIAILVDKYQILEVIAIHGDLWFSRLFSKIPSRIPDSDTGETLTWLAIAYVFRKPVQFRELTRLLERRCDHEIKVNADTLPIPDIIIESVNKKRTEALTEMYAMIKAHLEMYKHTPVPICDRQDREMAEACDSMLLGSLYKGAIMANIYPTPPVPYPNVAFRDLARDIQSLKVTSLCDQNKMSPPPTENIWGFGSGHGFSTLIRARILKIETRLKGLELSDFVDQKIDDFVEVRASTPPGIAAENPV